MSDNKLPSRPKSEEVAQLLAGLPSVLSVVLGKELPSELLSVISSIQSKLPEALHFINETNKTNGMPDTVSRNAALRNEIDIFVRSLASDLPEGKSGLENLIGRLEEHAAYPHSLGFLADTHYAMEEERLEGLVNSVFAGGLNMAIYLDSVDNSDPNGMMAASQLMSTKLTRNLKAIAKSRERYTRKVAKDCISVYGDLAGLLEKGLPLVVGLVELLNGKDADYLGIATRSLTANIKVVRASPYRVLAPDFDAALLRNAIAHKSYYFKPMKRKLKFVDQISGRSKELGYREFFVQTKELCSLTLVVHQLRFKLMLAQLRNIQKLISTS